MARQVSVSRDKLCIYVVARLVVSGAVRVRLVGLRQVALWRGVACQVFTPRFGDSFSGSAVVRHVQLRLGAARYVEAGLSFRWHSEREAHQDRPISLCLRADVRAWAYLPV